MAQELSFEEFCASIGEPARGKRRQSTPEVRRAKVVNARAKRLGAVGKISGRTIKQLWLSQNGRCCYCELELTIYYTIEHKTPLSRGGSNRPANIALACGDCNARKRNRTAEEFTGQNKDLTHKS